MPMKRRDAMSGARTITALAPWCGCNRAHAQRVGALLGDLDWCAVPFCGGCPELPYIRTRAGVAADLHRHVINLAAVIREPTLSDRLRDMLEAKLFHEDELAHAQRRLRAINTSSLAVAQPVDTPDPVMWAADYFVACWMGRGGHAGNKSELAQGLSARYTSSGGDSCKRFRSAVGSLPAWSAALQSWTFLCRDAFVILARCVDNRTHGIYVDPPWPDAGVEYRHAFATAQHRQLRDALRRFTRARVVVRYGTHPLIHDLYPACDGWTWHTTTTRSRFNGGVAEALIARNIAPCGITAESEHRNGDETTDF